MSRLNHRDATGTWRPLPYLIITIVLAALFISPAAQPPVGIRHACVSGQAGGLRPVLAAQGPLEEYEAPPGVDQAAVIAYHNQGNQFLALEMWEDAEAQFRAAIALDTGNPFSYNGLALAQYGRHDYDAAIQSCLTAIELRPGYAYVRCTLGLALFYSGSAASAISTLEEAIQLSSPGEAAFTLATALLKKFRAEMQEQPGSGMFSLQADDASVTAFLDNRESAEDILVGSPYNGSKSPAPGRASAEYEQQRALKVQQLIADTTALIDAGAGYAPVLDQLDAALRGAAGQLSVADAAALELRENIDNTLGAFADERRVATDFLARLDTHDKDPFVSRNLEYQRSLMAMRRASLLLEETDRLIIYAALVIREARRTMPQQAAVLEQELLANMAVHDREAARKAALDHALHYLDDGLRALDTADYYYGLEALAFMDGAMAEVRFRAMNLRTSERVDDATARQALGTVEYLAQLNRELHEQFDNMDTTRLLTDAELRAATGNDEPGRGLRAALSILAIRPAHAAGDDKVYSANVQRALQRDRRLFDRSTSEYQGIPHAVGGMVRFTQDLAGSGVDMADALVSTAVIPLAGAWYGDSGSEIWREVKGKYTAVGENYRNGTSGTRVLRTATEYMEATEGMAEQAASKTVRVLSDATVGGGNLAPWVAGKLAKTGVGLFTALGKGVNKVLDPTSTPGEVSHGVLHIGLTVASAGTAGLTAPVQSVSGAVRTAAGMGANGGMRELTAALGQGYITDSGKELIEWGGDKLTGFEDRPNPFLPGGPAVAVATPPAGAGTGQPATGSPSGDASGNGNTSGSSGGGPAPAGNGNGGTTGGPATGSSGNAGGPGNDRGSSGEGLPSEDTVPGSELPSCSITASVTAGPAPLRVSFSLSGSDAQGNALTSFEFSANGGAALLVGSSHTESFSNPGEYRITARSLDVEGLRSPPANVSITVFAPPKAVLGNIPQGGYEPYQVSFDFSGSTASGEGVQRYEFNDGKGGVHNSASVSLDYAAAGGKQSYTVSLVVYDSNGTASEPATASFDVYAPPVAAIRLSSELGEAPLAVTVDGSASQCFNGSFSNVRITDTAGHAASGQLTTTFQYDEPGQYTITLEVTDAGGKQAKISAGVEVTKPILQGVLVGSFSEPAPGRLELRLDAVNGSFTGFVSGVVNWQWGDMSGSVPYSGNLSGMYDPATGVLSGSLTGVCDGKPYTGSLSGVASGNSASGKWDAANEDGSYAGSWSAGG